MYAVTERENPLLAHYTFLLLDYAPLAVVSVPTLLCVALVGVAMYISGKGWGDRGYERSSGVFQVVTTRTDRSSGLISPTATEWSLPVTRRTDYSTAPPSSVPSSDGAATRASSWTDRTDVSSYRAPTITPSPPPPPPPPKDRSGELRQRKREMAELRLEKARLLAEYKSNVEILSEVSSVASTGSRKRRAPNTSGYRFVNRGCYNLCTHLSLSTPEPIPKSTPDLFICISLWHIISSPQVATN
eukprot:sb/3468936/